MKTDELIALLATGVQAVEPGVARRRYVTALGWGALGATLLMAIWLGVRRDIASASLLPMFWVKLAFPALILGGALLSAMRLAHPGMRVGGALSWIGAPLLAMGLLAMIVLLGAEPAARERLIFGVSWSVCPYYIAILSLPGLIAALWAMKGLAPTRPMLAGAVSGLAGGALGALAYALYCPEMAAPFIGIWYLAGMLIPTLAGGVVGRWFLRW